MKKHLSILTLLFVVNLLSAQQKLDTIYANEHKNVALFFPKPIRQGITGASHFVFTYNREKEQYFGLIQAKPGVESNLLVVTNNGQVYSYILKYRNELDKLNYFVAEFESIGNEVQKAIREKPSIPPISEVKKRELFFEKFSKHLLKLEPENLKTKRKKGLILQMQKMVYQGSEVYLVLEFFNNSGIDFEIDYLNIYRVNGNIKFKASYQRLEQEIIYEYKMPAIIKNNESKKWVVVVPKFVLGDNEKVEIEVKELNGNRTMQIKFKE